MNAIKWWGMKLKKINQQKYKKRNQKNANQIGYINQME
jgi:hypothetical protein